jgi:hypothetical protein
MVPLRLKTTELLDDCFVGCRQVHKHSGSKNKHDEDHTYLLEPFGGQVFESGPNNTKHVTCNGLTLHKQTNKQTKDRFPTVFMLLVYAATRDALKKEIYILNHSTECRCLQLCVIHSDVKSFTKVLKIEMSRAYYSVILNGDLVAQENNLIRL